MDGWIDGWITKLPRDDDDGTFFVISMERNFTLYCTYCTSRRIVYVHFTAIMHLITCYVFVVAIHLWCFLLHLRLPLIAAETTTPPVVPSIDAFSSRSGSRWSLSGTASCSNYLSYPLTHSVICSVILLTRQEDRHHWWQQGNR